MNENGIQETGQEEWDNSSKLIIEFNKEHGHFRFKFDGEIPSTMLVGYLEFIQSILIDNQKMAAMQHQQKLAATKIQVVRGKL